MSRKGRAANRGQREANGNMPERAARRGVHDDVVLSDWIRRSKLTKRLSIFCVAQVVGPKGPNISPRGMAAAALGQQVQAVHACVGWRSCNSASRATTWRNRGLNRDIFCQTRCYERGANVHICSQAADSARGASRGCGPDRRLTTSMALSILLKDAAVSCVSSQVLQDHGHCSTEHLSSRDDHSRTATKPW